MREHLRKIIAGVLLGSTLTLVPLENVRAQENNTTTSHELATSDPQQTEETYVGRSNIDELQFTSPTSLPPQAAAATYTFYMSHADVRNAKTAFDRGSTICGLVPMPTVFSPMCGGPAKFREAVNQAYYTNKRVKMVYHPCLNYCAYYDYYVVN